MSSMRTILSPDLLEKAGYLFRVDHFFDLTCQFIFRLSEFLLKFSEKFILFTLYVSKIIIGQISVLLWFYRKPCG